jgi:hypothetical protein
MPMRTVNSMRSYGRKEIMFSNWKENFKACFQALQEVTSEKEALEAKITEANKILEQEYIPDKPIHIGEYGKFLETKEVKLLKLLRDSPVNGKKVNKNSILQQILLLCRRATLDSKKPSCK